MRFTQNETVSEPLVIPAVPARNPVMTWSSLLASKAREWLTRLAIAAGTSAGKLMSFSPLLPDCTVLAPQPPASASVSPSSDQ